jgi:hypothetical protein
MKERREKTQERRGEEREEGSGVCRAEEGRAGEGGRVRVVGSDAA